jgi:CRP-like cAMP-binding protein
MSGSSDTTGPGTSGLFAPAIASLVGNLGLTTEDATRLCAMGESPAAYAAGEQIPFAARGGAGLIVSGWACEMRLLFDGRRQIFSFLMPGDLSLAPNFQSRPFALVALTPVRCLRLPAPDEEERPELTGVFYAVRRLNEARRFDALLRIGQLTASERTIHLLLEIRNRMVLNGTASGDSFNLPITQKQLADALGLSLVHVNRTLKALRRQALLSLRSGTVTLLQPSRLATLAMNNC